ncbi:hypothetical protein [Priestia aryabhattai]|uniref:hypothetical protein n=1 Tax=Priestia aryabhattai TaxID=412384 RepID=UPI001592CD91
MKQLTKVQQNIEEFLKSMIETEDSHEILEHLFAYYINNKSNNKIVVRDLINSIGEAFRVSPFTIIPYITSKTVYFGPGEFGLDYYEHMRLINKLKSKYGSVVRKGLTAEQTPFLLAGASINISKKDSLHRVKLMRADGENLEAMFKPDSLLNILTVLTNGLRNSMDNGIFSLEEEEVKKYLEIQNNLENKLVDLLDSEKNKETEEE